MMGVRVAGMFVVLTLVALGCSKTELPKGSVTAGDSGSGLLTAIIDGKADEVGKLLDAQPDLIYEVGTANVTPLHVAASTGNAEIVKLLLDRGADPTAMDDEGRTPLESAQVGRASQEVLDLLSNQQ